MSSISFALDVLHPLEVDEPCFNETFPEPEDAPETPFGMPPVRGHSVRNLYKPLL